LPRGVAIFATADQQQFESPGPIRRLRIVDMFSRGIKGLPAFLNQSIETFATDLVALEPAVGRQSRHRRAHHAAVDIQYLEKFQQRSEPYRTAARHDRIAEHGYSNGAGARGFALELFDDAGKRMRHPQRIARFQDLQQRSPAAASLTSAVGIGIYEAAPAAAVERRPLAFGLRQAIGHRIHRRGMMAHAAMAAFDLDAFGEGGGLFDAALPRTDAIGAA